MLFYLIPYQNMAERTATQRGIPLPSPDTSLAISTVVGHFDRIVGLKASLGPIRNNGHLEEEDLRVRSLNLQGMTVDYFERTVIDSPGRSVAVAAGRLRNGHAFSFPEVNARYMRGIVTNSRLKGRLSPDMEPKDIVGEAMEAHKLLRPQDLKVAVPDNLMNAVLAEQFAMTGVAVTRGGDLTSAVLAVQKHEPVLFTGFVERRKAEVGAMIATAGDGVFVGQYVEADGKKRPEIVTHEDLCPGDPATYFVSLATNIGASRYAMHDRIAVVHFAQGAFYMRTPMLV